MTTSSARTLFYYLASRKEAAAIVRDRGIRARPLSIALRSSAVSAMSDQDWREGWSVVCLSTVARRTAPPCHGEAPRVIRFTVRVAAEPLHAFARRQPLPVPPWLHRFRSRDGAMPDWYVHDGDIDLRDIGEVVDLMSGRRLYLDTPAGLTLRDT